eukprot:1003952_1
MRMLAHIGMDKLRYSLFALHRITLYMHRSCFIGDEVSNFDEFIEPHLHISNGIIGFHDPIDAVVRIVRCHIKIYSDGDDNEMLLCVDCGRHFGMIHHVQANAMNVANENEQAKEAMNDSEVLHVLEFPGRISIIDDNVEKQEDANEQAEMDAYDEDVKPSHGVGPELAEEEEENGKEAKVEMDGALDHVLHGDDPKEEVIQDPA